MMLIHCRASTWRQCDCSSCNERRKYIVKSLAAEIGATLALLGDDYLGEREIPQNKRRPLDSCVSEVLAQKDEEIKRLEEENKALRARISKQQIYANAPYTRGVE